MINVKELFLREISARIQEQSEAIANSTCTNMQEYGFSCGKVQGLKDAKGVFEDIWEKYKKMVDISEV